MLTVLAAAAVTLAAAPAGEPTLTPPQAQALRCGVVFALGAKLQEQKSPVAASWPPLGARGREYFVRVTAGLMDDTKASRDVITAMTMRQVAELSNPLALSAAMPGCLPLIDAAGL